MQLRRRHILSKRLRGQIYFFQKFLRFFYTRTCRKQIRDQFIYRQIDPALLRLAINSISREIKPGHTKSLLVNRFRIKRIVIHHRCHANHGKVMLPLFAICKMKPVISRCDHHLLPESAFQIQVSSEVKVLPLISHTRTHNRFSLFLMILYPV